MLSGKLNSEIYFYNLYPFIYSFDVRGKPLQQARHWSAPEIFGPRAHFNTDTDPATLDIQVNKFRPNHSPLQTRVVSYLCWSLSVTAPSLEKHRNMFIFRCNTPTPKYQTYSVWQMGWNGHPTFYLCNTAFSGCVYVCVNVFTHYITTSQTGCDFDRFRVLFLSSTSPFRCLSLSLSLHCSHAVQRVDAVFAANTASCIHRVASIWGCPGILGTTRHKYLLRTFDAMTRVSTAVGLTFVPVKHRAFDIISASSVSTNKRHK